MGAKYKFYLLFKIITKRRESTGLWNAFSLMNRVSSLRGFYVLGWEKGSYLKEKAHENRSIHNCLRVKLPQEEKLFSTKWYV